jgi:hypothetical protein
MSGERHILSHMDEGRKRVIGIMAAILAARKLCQLESTLASPALHSIIADAEQVSQAASGKCFR